MPPSMGRAHIGTYLRFPGGSEAGGGYSAGCLRTEARRIAGYLRDGVDLYAYFNNDQQACAIRNALDLRRYLQAQLPETGGGNPANPC